MIGTKKIKIQSVYEPEMGKTVPEMHEDYLTFHGLYSAEMGLRIKLAELKITQATYRKQLAYVAWQKACRRLDETERDLERLKAVIGS